MTTETLKVLVEIIMETRDRVEFLNKKLKALEEYILQADEEFMGEVDQAHDLSDQDFSAWLSSVLGDK